MSTTRHALIYVTNNTGGTANIHLSHRYSDDNLEQITWPDVPPGKEGQDPLQVHYRTGFITTGTDHWWVGLEVEDGPNKGNYASEGNADNPGKQCMLQADDDGKTLKFTADTNTFVMTLISGSCSTSVNPA